MGLKPYKLKPPTPPRQLTKVLGCIGTIRTFDRQVAEIKRAVFRALTRLRAATIKEFDTIARLETSSIDAYNDAHHYRRENPLSHLHEDEAPVQTDKLTR
ncbi:Lactation elevated protein 1 [Durusdinium trenchii]|uniref:Lactation elevated protein 1 n=1 Tax=Durusdinium trenchii TaxID=1381693 RepID=A0ABP0Q7B7_9DINO